ncbi:pirin family protein [Marinigracilibium pacificum]|uniref:Pirin family protein n=1 Tax=Marinigracilibium pacificum TaxID=2729599 RepID=A0A848IZE3_9BACT|nr:pirin family protein [Marinigracilibium pacificum]NMM47594.1 pirin family protein [Marinigracilibium pacificum]
MKKEIRAIHNAVYDPIADLKTWRAMPTQSINNLDPFLFLNHHGPQEYGPNNNGLPFGPHPHRGFETLTFVLHGDITHKDSVTGESVITKGGIQWMTAGSGLIHAEVSSDDFKKNGGKEEVIQLWFNLPSHLKMTEPKYIGLQKEKIPIVKTEDGLGEVQMVSGEFNNVEGPVKSLTNLFTSTITLKAGGNFQKSMSEGSQVLLYVINGKIEINNQEVSTHQLIELTQEGDEIIFEALEESILIFCFGKPFNEPIFAHGPFVMNTAEEINQAIMDFQSGKLGSMNL